MARLALSEIASILDLRSAMRLKLHEISIAINSSKKKSSCLSPSLSVASKRTAFDGSVV